MKRNTNETQMSEADRAWYEAVRQAYEAKAQQLIAEGWRRRDTGRKTEHFSKIGEADRRITRTLGQLEHRIIICEWAHMPARQA